jgi:hypothetical protein
MATAKVQVNTRLDVPLYQAAIRYAESQEASLTAIVAAAVYAFLPKTERERVQADRGEKTK